MAAGSGRAVLSTMLDRLLAGLMAGPNMNCRPHASRQRVDLTQLAKLNDASPESVLSGLLGKPQSAKVVAKVRTPRKTERKEDEPETDGQRRFREQQSLLQKVRLIADEARTYENDTGVAALAVGFPLISVPPPDGEGKRILAPIAFVPVSLSVKAGGTSAIDLACKAEAGDRVRPNAALLAWIEQQTGHEPPAENDDDTDPWGEVVQLVEHVIKALGVADPFAVPPEVSEIPSPSDEAAEADEEAGGDEIESPEQVELTDEEPQAEPLGAVGTEAKKITPPLKFTLQPPPRGVDDEADEEPRIIVSAVLGLFPVPNQGLMRDTRAMMSEESTGPVRAFLTAGIDFDAPPKVEAAALAIAPETVSSSPAWLAAAADPCQARAVSLARDGGALVVHGPPGTGKSQTITNVITDHLYRGERVLLVCDKRTALDVVADRLGNLGLRKLCGIVHDPRRDQQDLYRTIKLQLDELPDARTKPQAEGQLARVDADLRAVHDELMTHHKSLMSSTDDGPSFSELVGQWLAHGNDPGVRMDDAAAAGISVHGVAGNRAALTDLFERTRAVDLPRNPWAKCGGPTLADYLAKPMAAVRTTMARCVAAAEAADATNDAAIPPFNDVVALVEQANARVGWGKALAELIADVRGAGVVGWAGRDAAAIRTAAGRVVQAAPALRDVADHPLDDALHAVVVTPAELGPQLTAIQGYLAVAGSWSAAFAFSAKGEAKRVLSNYGLPLDKPSAERVQTYLNSLRTRATLAVLWADLTGQAGFPTDAQLLHLHIAADWFALLLQLADVPALSGLGPVVGRAASDATATDALLVGLAKSPARAEALNRLDEELLGAGLFGLAWLSDFGGKQRRGEGASETLRTLSDRVGTLEGVLRVRDARGHLPAELLPAVDALVLQGTDAETAVAALDRTAVERAIAERLRANPKLQQVDARRVESLFDQYRQLSDRRRELVRDAVEHRWVSKQKNRLLAAAGTKLNGVGADLKRRLTSRGKNANRLRQVIASGASAQGGEGDPLFDMCPIWMASPETVAQVFPRRALFDVVIFDEASQCRLEEALPVLVRGKRALIAGDPHQLPPTRFFESGLIRSEEDEDDETEQSLFEAHQANVEDLLSAALNLSVRQCYLDVHYRSRSPELIAFSNEHFYGRRLVPIPTRRDAGEPAVLLHRVEGTYEGRRNRAEADAVVEIVRDLLARKEPPSIGIACLNLVQRDLIVERLDEAAAEDPAFAKQLTAARAGTGATDGLFVKNLENVQGDERDEIIISTTYGPRPDGKFHRRFGPLGMPGGGRRLNVLVTRARDRVHLVSSIPAESYRSLPPIPEGQQAGGAWLLFAYLKFAADLGANVERPTLNVQHRTEEDVAAPSLDVESSTSKVERSPTVRSTRYPSALAEHVAASLADGGLGTDVYWGNDGFCVDIAPRGSDVGVLVDGCRYAGVGDPVDWDVFRTGVLAGQGWRLTRVWSPHFYRDPEGGLKSLVDTTRAGGSATR